MIRSVISGYVTLIPSDVYDIVLKDTHAIHPALSMFSKHKENVELLGQYDGQPNKFNEKILSLDVEKILYYVGLGKR